MLVAETMRRLRGSREKLERERERGSHSPKLPPPIPRRATLAEVTWEGRSSQFYMLEGALIFLFFNYFINYFEVSKNGNFKLLPTVNSVDMVEML